MMTPTRPAGMPSAPTRRRHSHCDEFVVVGRDEPCKEHGQTGRQEGMRVGHAQRSDTLDSESRFTNFGGEDMHQEFGVREKLVEARDSELLGGKNFQEDRKSGSTCVAMIMGPSYSTHCDASEASFSDYFTKSSRDDEEDPFVTRGFRKEDHTGSPELPISAPEALRVTSPNAHTYCEGIYYLVHGFYPNNYPVWRQRGGAHWLFSGLDGMLLFGDSEQASLQFVSREGYIASVEEHEGRMPHEVLDWQQDDGCDWLEDEDISVCIVDEDTDSDVDDSSDESTASFCGGEGPKRVSTMLQLPRKDELLAKTAQKVNTWC